MKTSVISVMYVMVWWGCAAAQTVPQNATPTSELISPALIDRAGWTMNWQLKLPLRASETVDRIVIFDEYLYVLTDRNVLFCINRQAGTMRFVTPLAPRGLPICDPISFENNLLFMVGNELVVVDPWAGTIAERYSFAQIGNTYECGLAMNSEYVYLTGSDARLYAYSRDGYWRVFSATADNNSPIISLAALEDRVLFATQAGNVVAIAPNRAEKYWQFDATGTIDSELVVSEGKVYIGSHDTKLYQLDVNTGRLAWPSPFHAGARIHKPVVIGQDLVYLTAGTMGVYGINKETGRAVWQVRDGLGVLTETVEHSFVLSRTGLLNVMDNATGRKLYSVNFSRVRRFATKMDEPRLYVADEGGRIAGITVR